MNNFMKIYNGLQLNYDSLTEVINKNIEINKRPLFLLCDAELATIIDQYLWDEHELEDTDLDKDFEFVDGQQYLISIMDKTPDEEYNQIFIEEVIRENGKMFYTDVEDGVLIDMTDLDSGLVKEHFNVDSIFFAEYEYDEDTDDYDESEEHECPLEEIVDYIEALSDKVQELEDRIEKLENRPSLFF